MTIILKLIDENFDNLFFELPDFVEYGGKFCNKFSMASPANLVRALNTNNEKLSDLLVGKENYKAFWESAKIKRKKIVVKKFSSSQEKKDFVENLKKERKLASSFRNCVICEKRCLNSKKMIGCCSESCFQMKLKERNQSVSDTHWCKSKEFQEITAKRIETRKKKDKDLCRKYVAWNAGKTGIYSLETIEKIRAATRNQFHREIFKKTSIEKKIEEFLKETSAKYKYSFILSGRQFDFVVNNKILIEAHGDFWHGNPAFYGSGLKPLRDHQVMKQLDDKTKRRIAQENGYKYFEFWEHDIHKNWDDVKLKLTEIINAN